jgi:hypothetical protein
MAELKTKLMTLAGAAVMFAGMAHAQQLDCSQVVPVSTPNFVAAEGTTEQVSDVSFNCGQSTTDSTVTITVYLSPAASITSKTLGSGSTARNEAMAGLTANFTAGGATSASVIAGKVTGSTITFSDIAVPANTPAVFTITNIKIDASQIPATTGAPQPVQETIFVGGTNVLPGSLKQAANVAYSASGLASVGVLKSDGTSGTPSSVQICVGNDAFDVAKPSFFVEFAEGFPGAFKVQGDAAVNTTLGSQVTGSTYTGYGVVAPVANTATSGTRIQIEFDNIPANVTLYMPLTWSNNGGTVSAIQSISGFKSLANPTAAVGSPGSKDNKSAPTVTSTYMALSASNGTAFAYYEETAPNATGVEDYKIPVYLQAGAAAVTAPSSNITATVTLGPVGASSNVPNFVAGTATAQKANAFSACSTTLLFPFVTNQQGFDTGLAIANASSDLLDGGTKTKAAKQDGTCTLTFFGGDENPDPVKTDTIKSGTVYAHAASELAPNFQGYMIASCNFLYGHGFAYVVYNLTQNNGAAMGYLADAITADRKSQISSGSVSSKVVDGVVTVSGSVNTSSVGSNNPEQ